MPEHQKLVIEISAKGLPYDIKNDTVRSKILSGYKIDFWAKTSLQKAQKWPNFVNALNKRLLPIESNR